MTDMVEKVANAIGDHIEEAHISHLKIAARAAIRALMEPAEEMVDAGIQFFMTRDPSLDSFAKLSRAQWQAMLKAALDD